MEIKIATLNDLEQLYSFQEKNNTIFISKEALLKSKDVYFIAKENGKIIAFLSCTICVDYVDIDYILVDKDYRKQNIASSLIKTLINYVKVSNLSNFNSTNMIEYIALEVRKSNISAINLYKKFNFEYIYTRKNYYSSPAEDALIFRLDV